MTKIDCEIEEDNKNFLSILKDQLAKHTKYANDLIRKMSPSQSVPESSKELIKVLRERRGLINEIKALEKMIAIAEKERNKNLEAEKKKEAKTVSNISSNTSNIHNQNFVNNEKKPNVISNIKSNNITSNNTLN